MYQMFETHRPPGVSHSSFLPQYTCSRLLGWPLPKAYWRETNAELGRGQHQCESHSESLFSERLQTTALGERTNRVPMQLMGGSQLERDCRRRGWLPPQVPGGPLYTCRTLPQFQLLLLPRRERAVKHQGMPTDTHQFLHIDSCHPVQCKTAIPYSQTLRLKRICSDEEHL